MSGESFGAKHFTIFCLTLHVEEILIIKNKHLECLSFVLQYNFFQVYSVYKCLFYGTIISELLNKHFDQIAIVPHKYYSPP